MGHSVKPTVLDELLTQKFTSNFRSGYTECEGITLPIRYDELKAAIDDFEVFEDDVWVCSFPKTGTTWSQEMIWLIANDFNYTAAEENLGARFPFLEVSVVFDFRKLKSQNADFIPPIFLDDSLKFVKEMKRPRFIKTHLPWDLLPKQIRTNAKQPKIVYITRSPKDVCISYFHHVRLLEGFTGSFDEFVELFLAGKITFGPFWRNVLPFWEMCKHSNIFFVKYEDMKRNLETIVDDTAEFLQKDVTDEQKAKLLKHLSFESMKLNQSVNYEPVVEFHRKHNLVQVDGTFMRSGGKDKDNNKLEMTPDVLQRFDLWIKQHDANNELNYHLV